MLKRLLANSDWQRLSTFVTPALLDVVPVRKVVARAREVRVSRNSDTYRRAVTLREQGLRDLPLDISLTGAGSQPDGLGEGQAADARRVVTLYFHQLLHPGGPTLLDLRADSLRSRDTGAGLAWNPAPWVCAWDAAFIRHLRDVYSGFYTGDEARFRRGLEALDIGVAEDLFREHFGSDQTSHRFRVQQFMDTFEQIFKRCRDARVTLHPDFVMLGLYLASLYDNLEEREVTVDVRACFTAASDLAAAA